MGAPNANVGIGMGGSQGQMNQMGHEEAKIYQLVMDLMDPSRREGALLELSKKREQYDDLALVLWHSFGTSRIPTPSQIPTLTMSLRYHACPPSGNRLCLSPIIPS